MSVLLLCGHVLQRGVTLLCLCRCPWYLVAPCEESLRYGWGCYAKDQHSRRCSCSLSFHRPDVPLSGWVEKIFDQVAVTWFRSIDDHVGCGNCKNGPFAFDNVAKLRSGGWESCLLASCFCSKCLSWKVSEANEWVQHGCDDCVVYTRLGLKRASSQRIGLRAVLCASDHDCVVKWSHVSHGIEYREASLSQHHGERNCSREAIRGTYGLSDNKSPRAPLESGQPLCMTGGLVLCYIAVLISSVVKIA